MILALAVLLGCVVIAVCGDLSVTVLVCVAVGVLFLMARADRRDSKAVENMLDWWAKDGKGHNE